jgi:hypothetical protein
LHGRRVGGRLDAVTQGCRPSPSAQELPPAPRHTAGDSGSVPFRRVRGHVTPPRAAPSSTGPLLDVIADRRASALERSRCRRPPPDTGAHRPARGPRRGRNSKHLSGPRPRPGSGP